HKKAWQVMHENFPEIYNDLHTVIDPYYIQYGDQIFHIQLKDYPTYLQMWMNAFQTLPPYFSQEEGGHFFISENGELQEYQEDEEVCRIC
ncbi:MAG: hypothetical protein WCK03_04025, partial [Candidatus Taylorbacteria bacterium]